MQVSPNVQFALYHRIRLAKAFSDPAARLALTELRLLAFSVLVRVQAHGEREVLNGYLQEEPDFVWELAEMLKSEVKVLLIMLTFTPHYTVRFSSFRIQRRYYRLFSFRSPADPREATAAGHRGTVRPFAGPPAPQQRPHRDRLRRQSRPRGHRPAKVRRHAQREPLR
jgi:hypothetical protein